MLLQNGKLAPVPGWLSKGRSAGDFLQYSVPMPILQDKRTRLGRILLRWMTGLTAIVLLAGLAPARAADAARPPELISLPFEQLLDMEYVPASKMARQITDAPSAVSIVTADDIRAYGYRTLAEIFNSLPGLYTPYDGSIWTLGGRGFGRPGDYTGRVLLMIDRKSVV